MGTFRTLDNCPEANESLEILQAVFLASNDLDKAIASRCFLRRSNGEDTLARPPLRIRHECRFSVPLITDEARFFSAELSDVHCDQAGHG
jgi:hypothetical protein